METKFQTSFIPKRTLVPAGPGTVTAPPEPKGFPSLLMTIGTFLFIASLIVAAGSYGWKAYLTSQQVSLNKDLTALRSKFKLDSMKTYKTTSVKIDQAKQLLNNHIAISTVFAIASQMVAQNIRLTSFEFNASSEKSKGASIKASGYGPNYESVAYESDALGHRLDEMKLRNYISNPVISNPTQNQNGAVTFSLSADINPASILYK